MSTDPLRVYELYGLRVASPIPLAVPESDETKADLEIRLGAAAAVPAAPPPGKLIREFTWGEGNGLACSRDEEGYLLRFYSTCDFRIDSTLRAVEICPDPELDPDMLAPLLEGPVISGILALQGECVLHASAVEVAGRALAFVGGSGKGKSTMATLLCLSGASLVSDDVLRIDLSGDEARCFPGARRTRLRSNAAGLLDSLSAGEVERTGDDRFGADFAAGRSERPLLTAILVPKPSRTAEAVRLERLDAAKGFVVLSSFPRIYGWREGDWLRQQFQSFSQLAKSVPVFTAEVPWGPPFDPGIAGELMALTGLVVGEEAVGREK
jgi:hypothetical protein